MSVWRKPPPLFSTHFELLRSQQDCGERKIFIDSGDSEDKEGCQRRHSAVQTLPSIVMAEGSTTVRKQGAQYGNAVSARQPHCSQILKSRWIKIIKISIDQTTKTLTAHTSRGKTLGVARLEINDMIIYTLCVWWTGKFTKEQTMKWPSSNTISTAACDSEVRWLKSRSAWGYLSCDRRQEWTTHCFMLERTYVCETLLCFEWDMLDRYLPKDTAKQQCFFASQTEPFSKTKHSRKFWEWQPQLNAGVNTLN